MSTDSPDSTPPIKPLLDEAEAEVSRRLQTVSETDATDISEESSEELRKLEDELLAAVRAVEQTVAIRRVMEHSSGTEEVQAKGARPDAEPPCVVREFTDRDGRAWRGWQVVPGRARPHPDAGRFLGAYAKGWLAFEALDGRTRKRLLAPTDTWASLTEEELVALLERATEVAPRSR